MREGDRIVNRAGASSTQFVIALLCDTANATNCNRTKAAGMMTNIKIDHETITRTSIHVPIIDLKRHVSGDSAHGKRLRKLPH